ncbi:MAG: hypothetical protein QF614_09365, partial [SAR324 cluster bacterium]|nr:hypothetical protein [SAR324 cluster bacterium]
SVTATDNYSASLGVTLSSGDGAKTVYGWLRDTAGNIGGSASDNISLDTTAPTVSVGSPSDNHSNSGPVSYTVSYTGADNVTLVADNVTVSTTGTAAAGSKSVTGSGTATRTITLDNLTGSGTLAVSIASATATDLAGNSAPTASASDNITVDNTAPSGLALTVAGGDAYATAQAVSLTLSGSDNH